uniref:CCHC-type domain-containing protein n=1 Tax=Brassica campestris TaxID=3711 RepID=M4CIP9_BRACM
MKLNAQNRKVREARDSLKFPFRQEPTLIYQNQQEVDEEEEDITVSQIKEELYEALEGINRGVFGVKSDKKAEIERLVKLLECRNPTPELTGELDKIGGKTVHVLKFDVRGLNLHDGEFRIIANFKIISKSSVEITYESSTIMPDKLMNIFKKNMNLLLGIFNPEGLSWIVVYGGRNKVPQRQQGICTGNEGSADTMHDVLSKVPPFRNTSTNVRIGSPPSARWKAQGQKTQIFMNPDIYDDFSEIYKEYTSPQVTVTTNVQEKPKLPEDKCDEEEEQQELPDPNSVPTDFISREAKVWEAKSKATERNRKKRKEEEMICKICGESGHFTQGCPSTLGANRKSQEFLERVPARDKNVRDLFTEKVVERIESETGCKIKMDDKFIIVSGKDRLILRKGLDAVHKVREEGEAKTSSASHRSISRITNMGLIENRDPPLPSMGSLPSQSQFDDSYVSSGPTETQKSLEEGGEGDFTVAIPGMVSSQVDEGSSAETVLDPFANRDRRTTVETQTAPSTIMISIRLADGIGTALELFFRSNQTIRDICNAIDQRYPDNDGLRFAIGGWSRLHGLECNCIQSFYLWYSSLPDQTLAFVLVQCPLTDETEKERDGKRIHIDIEKDSCFV